MGWWHEYRLYEQHGLRQRISRSRGRGVSRRLCRRRLWHEQFGQDVFGKRRKAAGDSHEGFIPAGGQVPRAHPLGSTGRTLRHKHALARLQGERDKKVTKKPHPKVRRSFAIKNQSSSLWAKPSSSSTLTLKIRAILHSICKEGSEGPFS